MSTRSIIVVTGKGRCDKENYRLYKHCDGYPSGNLPVIAEALERGVSIVDEAKKDLTPSAKLTPDTLTGLLVGACVTVHGMGAEIEDHTSGECDVLGNQGDLEWVYIIDTDTKSVNVYGGHYVSNNTPQKMVKAGTVDPLDYLDSVSDSYQDKIKQEIEEAVKAVKDTGYEINRDKEDKCPTCGADARVS